MQTEIPEDIEFLRVYFVSGTIPKGSEMRPSVKDPPTAGWSGVIRIKGEKRSWLLCPHTLWAAQVSNDAYEITSSKPSSATVEKAVARVLDTWKLNQVLGLPSDLDTAARFLQKVGAEVPTAVAKVKTGEEVKSKRGGKEAAAELLKSVKQTSKRGKVLSFVLNDHQGACAIRELMAEFDDTRSSVLSTMYVLNKDHGIGYELNGDEVSVQLPPGCDNPFDVDAVTGDSFLD